MYNSYYINRNIFEKNYTNISFIDKHFINIEDFTNIFVYVKIYETSKFERKLKLDKLNNKNTQLIYFIEFVKSNDVPLTNVINILAQQEQNKIKYNSINHYYNTDTFKNFYENVNIEYFIPND